MAPAKASSCHFDGYDHEGEVRRYTVPLDKRHALLVQPIRIPVPVSAGSATMPSSQPSGSMLCTRHATLVGAEAL